MRSKMMFLLVFVILMAATPVFAQTSSPSIDPKSFTAFGAVLGMAIASGLCGLAQGKAVASATEAIARNPGAAAAIRGALILGLVLIESLALYTLVVVFTR
jgi:F-type H+-transporting ATPase subunit c